MSQSVSNESEHYTEELKAVFLNDLVASGDISLIKTILRSRLNQTYNPRDKYEDDMYMQRREMLMEPQHEQILLLIKDFFYFFGAQDAWDVFLHKIDLSDSQFQTQSEILSQINSIPDCATLEPSNEETPLLSRVMQHVAVMQRLTRSMENVRTLEASLSTNQLESFKKFQGELHSNAALQASSSSSSSSLPSSSSSTTGTTTPSQTLTSRRPSASSEKSSVSINTNLTNNNNNNNNINNNSPSYSASSTDSNNTTPTSGSSSSSLGTSGGIRVPIRVVVPSNNIKKINNGVVTPINNNNSDYNKNNNNNQSRSADLNISNNTNINNNKRDRLCQSNEIDTLNKANNINMDNNNTSSPSSDLKPQQLTPVMSYNSSNNQLKQSYMSNDTSQSDETCNPEIPLTPSFPTSSSSSSQPRHVPVTPTMPSKDNTPTSTSTSTPTVRRAYPNHGMPAGGAIPRSPAMVPQSGGGKSPGSTPRAYPTFNS